MNTQNDSQNDFDALELLPVSHSEGPWWVGYVNAEKAQTSTLAVIPANMSPDSFGKIVCRIAPELAQDETDHANARLIAASPELLSALLVAGRIIRQSHDLESWQSYQNCLEMQQINQAIAKALCA